MNTCAFEKFFRNQAPQKTSFRQLQRVYRMHSCPILSRLRPFCGPGGGWRVRTKQDNHT